jgi:hypothetical protein
MSRQGSSEQPATVMITSTWRSPPPGVAATASAGLRSSAAACCTSAVIRSSDTKSVAGADALDHRHSSCVSSER